MNNIKLKERIVISSETETSSATSAKSETSKDINVESSQSRKHKRSPDRERPSKVAKHDAEEDASSAVCDLTIYYYFDCKK